jgi:ferrochelatase
MLVRAFTSEDGAVSVDAILVLGFGGPESAEDVLPFLDNVTRGRGVPRERLEEVAEHYYALGGRSPINDQNRALVAALEGVVDVPVFWGNRNWAPYVEDAVRAMAATGITHAACYATSAYAGYSSCRQYREDLARARAAVGAAAPRITKLRHFFDHPGFIEPMARNTRDALELLPEDVRRDAPLVFTAHSVPVAAAERAGPDGGAYVAQLREASRLVATRVGGERRWDLVWQSRSGDPRVPWLEPDVSDHLRTLAAAGAVAAVVVPVGFVSDHVEVLHDLDGEARDAAEEAGVVFARARTVGTAPEFVGMIAELVREVDDVSLPRRRLGGDPRLHWEECPPSCCLPGGTRRDGELRLR